MLLGRDRIPLILLCPGVSRPTSLSGGQSSCAGNGLELICRLNRVVVDKTHLAANRDTNLFGTNAGSSNRDGGNVRAWRWAHRASAVTTTARGHGGHDSGRRRECQNHPDLAIPQDIGFNGFNAFNALDEFHPFLPSTWRKQGRCQRVGALSGPKSEGFEQMAVIRLYWSRKGLTEPERRA